MKLSVFHYVFFHVFCVFMVMYLVYDFSILNKLCLGHWRRQLWGTTSNCIFLVSPQTRNTDIGLYVAAYPEIVYRPIAVTWLIA